MNKDELAMKLLDKLLFNENEESVKPVKPLIGEYVIVRCRDAGVHAGILVNYENRNVELKETRRLWYFKCETGHSLSGVALHGLTGDSKIAGELNSILLMDACEIIPANEKSERSIRSAKEYNPS